MSGGAFITASMLLLAGSFVLAGFIFATLQGGAQQPSTAIIRSQGSAGLDAPEQGVEGLPADVAEVSAGSLEVIEDRPLFSQTRRPPEAEAPAAEPARGPGDIELIGTMLWDEERRAVFRIAGQAKEQTVPEGGSVGGWRVISVETRSVVLERNGERETLNLKYGEMPGIESRGDEQREREQ